MHSASMHATLYQIVILKNIFIFLELNDIKCNMHIELENMDKAHTKLSNIFCPYTMLVKEIKKSSEISLHLK